MEIDATTPVAPFVQQLYKLVHEGIHINWAADGAALVIQDPTKFAADRCPVYFKHSNWTSFARMLNMYEFRRRKSADGSAIFAHPHFTRDGAHLSRVVRKKRASASTWEDVDALSELPAPVAPVDTGRRSPRDVLRGQCLAFFVEVLPRG